MRRYFREKPRGNPCAPAVTLPRIKPRPATGLFPRFRFQSVAAEIRIAPLSRFTKLSRFLACGGDGGGHRGREQP
jgi:hypothetical protein